VRNGGEGWNAALRDLNIQAEDAAAIRYIYLEQEQIELSACIIGANPDALAKSFASGCVKDADLASVGFSDEDMNFLTVAGKALEAETLTAIERVLIEREICRITGGQEISNGNQKHHTSNSPGKPGGGELAERQAAERTAFLKKMQALSK
jgi:hypothetical protein